MVETNIYAGSTLLSTFMSDNLAFRLLLALDVYVNLSLIIIGVLMMKKLLVITTIGLLLFLGLTASSHLQPESPDHKLTAPVDRIVIKKAKRLMTVFSKGRELRTYRVALGFSPIGHKQEEGDGRTPEGIYSISYKNPSSRYYKSLKISYPNPDDLKRARSKGVSAGGEIYIHGLHPAFSIFGSIHHLKDWTLGCIAISNSEIEGLFDSVEVGTVVEIKE